jgi:hypothetical protein
VQSLCPLTWFRCPCYFRRIYSRAHRSARGGLCYCFGGEVGRSNHAAVYPNSTASSHHTVPPSDISQYFTLSGLKTNLGLLDTGVVWGYVILLCVVAFVGKFVGCSAVARLSGFNIRESSAIGVLMSCKGLVELIVLNIGLQAGILDQRLFS